MNQETTGQTTGQMTASKDYFFAQLGKLADEMVAAHGKDFAMGAMVLAARFIAEGAPSASPLGASTAAADTRDPSRVISSRVS
jgi:hypothetical protein